MKIAIIGTVGLPSNYGGFESLADNIVNDLNKDFDFTIYCSSKSYSKKLETYNNSKLYYVNLKANGIQSVFYDICSILHAIKHSDILLILGVSGCVILPLIKLFSKKKIIINIDGLEWKRQKWGRFAKWFLKLSERLAIKFADEVIGDNKVIVEYIEKSYLKKANLITYGGDNAKNIFLSNNLKSKYKFLSNHYAFKVCRIEPENNVEMILKSFSKLSSKNLVMVGNWSNSKFGMKMKSKYKAFNNIFLLDPIYDQNILNQLRSNCEIYVHGHSAGGTNPSLVEAMFLGLPIFSFAINYNVQTTSNSALFFKTSDDLMNLIKSSKKADLKRIGLRMQKIANERYRWSVVSNEYKQLFLKVLN